MPPNLPSDVCIHKSEPKIHKSFLFSTWIVPCKRASVMCAVCACIIPRGVVMGANLTDFPEKHPPEPNISSAMYANKCLSPRMPEQNNIRFSARTFDEVLCCVLPPPAPPAIQIHLHQPTDNTSAAAAVVVGEEEKNGKSIIMLLCAWLQKGGFSFHISVRRWGEKSVYFLTASCQGSYRQHTRAENSAAAAAVLPADGSSLCWTRWWDAGAAAITNWKIFPFLFEKDPRQQCWRRQQLQTS